LGLASKKSAKDMEELKKATKVTQSLAEELEATRVAFTVAFGPFIQNVIIPLLDHLQGFAEWLNTNVGENGAATVAVIAGVGLMGIAFTGLMMTVTAVIAPPLALAASLGALNTTLAATAAAGPLASKGIKELGKAGAGGAPGMAAFGSSVLMVGAGLGAVGLGIGAAAAGISMLVDSLSNLSASAKDFQKIGETFKQLDIPKMIVYTAAMSATALVGSTPAAAVIAERGAAVGGKGKEAERPIEVEVNVELTGELKEYFMITKMDKRYAQRSSISPGGRLPAGQLTQNA
jgi:hypothetical protein